MNRKIQSVTGYQFPTDNGGAIPPCVWRARTFGHRSGLDQLTGPRSEPAVVDDEAWNEIFAEINPLGSSGPFSTGTARTDALTTLSSDTTATCLRGALNLSFRRSFQSSPCRIVPRGMLSSSRERPRHTTTTSLHAWRLDRGPFQLPVTPAGAVSISVERFSLLPDCLD